MRRLSIHAVYRFCIWLPILVPAVVIVLLRTFGVGMAVFFVPEVLVYSLVYGGLPYAALAVWATWWVGGRSEADIRGLMYRAPIVMALLFVACALVAGLAIGEVQPFLVVAVLGVAVILPLGYLYVGIALLVRNVLGPAPQ